MLSCATTPKTPSWDVSPDAFSKTFPNSRYIAQRGTGADKASAEADAASQIARYFSTQVSYQFSEQLQNSQTNTDIQTIINSNIQVFGIRYTADPYINNKQWVTVAYIDRNEAWQIFQPKVKQYADALVLLITEASNEKDPFKKALLSIAAQNYYSSDDYQNVIVFGQILHHSFMYNEISNTITLLSGLPQLIDTSKRNASIYIDCTDDFESMITNAFTREFTIMGFPVSNEKNNTSAICKITITEGRQERDMGIFYHPSLQAVITGNTGVLWTFSTQAERASAVTPDVAKRRAFQNLTEKIKNSQLLISNF